MNMIAKVRSLAASVRRAIGIYRKIARDGGVTYVNVAQISRGAVLQDRWVLVTGGSRGIGFEIAKKCLAEGASVVISGRSEANLRTAVDKLGAGRVRTLVWDIREMGRIKDKLGEALALAGGRLDVVVNNAGVFPRANFWDTTEEMWDVAMDTNAKGPFFLSQAVGKHWIGLRQRGKIINVASTGGYMGAMTPYRMSKWGIVGLTRGLGLFLYPHGIIVNGVAPGITSSEMLGYDATDNAFAHYPPSNRVALAEEVADLVLFLASDAANHIVGQTIVCDGGYSLKN